MSKKNASNPSKVFLPSRDILLVWSRTIKKETRILEKFEEPKKIETFSLAKNFLR